VTENRSVVARVLRAAIAVGVVVALSEVASSAVHKCAAPGGIVYQDRPCREGEARDADVLDAPLSVLPFPSPGRQVQTREPPANPTKPMRAERARRAESPAPGNPAERRHLRVGMSEGEVMARVGPPDLTTGKGRKQSRWTWMPVPGDPDTITVVLFETGRAIEVERTVVKR
jgi:hypothetical protein